MDVYSVQTYRLNMSIYTLYIIEKELYWNDVYEEKNIHAYTKHYSRFVR